MEIIFKSTLLFFLLCLTNNISCDRTSLKIYQDIQSDYFCFRLLNATHQIGCSATKRGNIGVVHYVQDVVEDIDWIISKGLDAPYVVALPIKYFTIQNMLTLRDSDRVKGVLILKNPNETLPSFTPDSSCPNEKFEFYSINQTYSQCKKTAWNPNLSTNDFMFTDWKMPIFLITKQDDIDNIINNCFIKFNKPINSVSRPWPLCSAQLKTEMSAAKDTETCMRRSNHAGNVNSMRFCDPLKDSNIITTLFDVNKNDTYENNSILVLATKIDAFSLFDALSPGAHTTVTGLVTFLSVAHTLASVREDIRNKTHFSNVLFAIFNGETFGYIGSSRAVFDMNRGVFPVKLDDSVPVQPSLIRLEHLSHFIEISQMNPKKPEVYAHTDPISSDKGQKANIEKVISIFKTQSGKYKVKESEPNIPLPPASLQSFLKKTLDITGVVLADHKQGYINKYYNSFYDNNETLAANNNSRQELVEKLTDISTTISRSVYEILTNESNQALKADEPLIAELIECYLLNSSCDFFQRIAGVNAPQKHSNPYPFYVSVGTGSQRGNTVTIYTRHAMANLTGTVREDIDKEDCTSNINDDQLHYYDWVVSRPGHNSSGKCLESTSLYTVALSPAFELNDWKSSEYPTWTESVWSEVKVRIFLQPSQYQEIFTLITGIVILILSFVVVIILKKHYLHLFESRQLCGC